MDFESFFGNLLKTFLRFDLNYLVESAWPILGPMLLGSVPTVIVAWLVFFLAWRWSIGAYRKARAHRRRGRQRKNRKGEGDGSLSAPRR